MEKLTLGQYFRNERQRLGIELKDIERRTKIPCQTLIWLEADNTDVLPPRAFLRGFLQVISKEFGMDEAELFRLMDENVVKQENIKSRPAAKNKTIIMSNKKIYFIIAAVVIAVIVLVIGFFALYNFEVSSADRKDGVKIASIINYTGNA